MIKEELFGILKEIVTDEEIKTDEERLITVGYNSILSLHFVSAIEDFYNIELDNDHINAQFFSDFDYLENTISSYVKN